MNTAIVHPLRKEREKIEGLGFGIGLAFAIMLLTYLFSL